MGNDSQTESLEFESSSQLASPGVAVGRDLLPWLRFSVDVRYVVDIAQNLLLKSNNDVYLVNSQYTPQGASWSGARVVGLLSVKLSK